MENANGTPLSRLHEDIGRLQDSGSTPPPPLPSTRPFYVDVCVKVFFSHFRPIFGRRKFRHGILRQAKISHPPALVQVGGRVSVSGRFGVGEGGPTPPLSSPSPLLQLAVLIFDFSIDDRKEIWLIFWHNCATSRAFIRCQIFSGPKIDLGGLAPGPKRTLVQECRN